MNTNASRFLPTDREARLKELDLEIVRLAIICKIRLLDPGSIQHPNTVAARSGPRHGKKGKTFPKILQLGFESRRRQAVLLHLHKILFLKR